MIEKLADFVNRNKALVRRGRYVNYPILVGVGEDDFIVEIEHGRIANVRRRDISIDSGRFAIRAPAEIWREFWQPMPKRDHHDLFGMMAANLALEHPDDFRAVIALEGANWLEPNYSTEWLHRPDVHGGQAAAGYVSGQIAPQSPSEYRWETLWAYSTACKSKTRRAALAWQTHLSRPF